MPRGAARACARLSSTPPARCSRAGFAGVTLAPIGERCGHSAAAIYRHFEDKTALLFEVCAQDQGRLAAALGEGACRCPHGRRGPAGGAGRLRGVGPGQSPQLSPDDDDGPAGRCRTRDRTSAGASVSPRTRWPPCCWLACATSRPPR
ncbi:TetR/AcrR family transcriptional regulator [Cupriavidus basilensis]